MISLLSLIFIALLAEVIDSNTKLPKYCADVEAEGKDIHGVYNFQVSGQKFSAFCLPDPHYGPAWTMILRRWDGSVNFNRSWTDYEKGFGNKSGEYWLGLKAIHALTTKQECDLWVQLGNWKDKYKFARYTLFMVDSRKSHYALRVGGYFGDAGDSFGTVNTGEFSTYDKERLNCSKSYGGGWWWMTDYCGECHLTAPYKKHGTPELPGIKWDSFMGPFEPLKYAHMAIRPSKWSWLP